MKDKIYKNKIEDVMSLAMQNIRSLVDVDVVVGKSISNNQNISIYPLTKVTMGFVAGGGEYNNIAVDEKLGVEYPFTGGSGAGVSLQPIAFLVVEKSKVSVVKIDSKSMVEKLIEVVPEVAKFVNLNFYSKDKNAKK